MYLRILLPSILALGALYKKKLTNSAIILAWVFGLIIIIFGGYYAFGALVLTFLLTIFSDKLKKKEDRDEKRNVYQIISNVMVPTLAIILFYVTDKLIFYIMYYCVIGSSLADTLASSIGPLSTKKPINIFTLKRMEHGDSGAVSFLGLNASIFGGIIIGIVYYIETLDITNYLLIVIMSTLGSFIDSMLGVSMQAKYECVTCHKKIEEEIHCNKKAKLIHGYKFMNNNTVNLLNNIFVFIISYIFLL
jgi:uncharacterized protein (TIGR00297 family)